MKEKKLYIAGPMRGYYKFNFPRFDEARDVLKSLGYTVISPADLDREFVFDPTSPYFTPPYVMDGDDGLDPKSAKFQSIYIREIATRDLNALIYCDGIVLLPGWENSIGAQAELAVAKWIGLEIYYYREGHLYTNDNDSTIV
jgi:hypothetical protein